MKKLNAFWLSLLLCIYLSAINPLVGFVQQLSSQRQVSTLGKLLVLANYLGTFLCSLTGKKIITSGLKPSQLLFVAGIAQAFYIGSIFLLKIPNFSDVLLYIITLTITLLAGYLFSFVFIVHSMYILACSSPDEDLIGFGSSILTLNTVIGNLLNFLLIKQIGQTGIMFLSLGLGISISFLFLTVPDRKIQQRIEDQAGPTDKTLGLVQITLLWGYMLLGLTIQISYSSLPSFLTVHSHTSGQQLSFLIFELLLVAAIGETSAGVIYSLLQRWNKVHRLWLSAIFSVATFALYLLQAYLPGLILIAALCSGITITSFMTVLLFEVKRQRSNSILVYTVGSRCLGVVIGSLIDIWSLQEGVWIKAGIVVPGLFLACLLAFKDRGRPDYVQL